MRNTVQSLCIVLAVTTASAGVAHAGERFADGAMGAVAGALVAGPVGLVAGGIVGATAGPSIARSWGLKKHRTARRTYAYRRYSQR